ncbi:hypothetical protein ACFVMC_21530 [Nocardia sp. NPDC127579]|uniref:hypothetical protein n=1 Tax=Nocardia sp. NPDC127579 TaxID=3345402 RepID=UPI00363861B9
MATVGISVERTVVRGVVLRGEPPAIVSRATRTRRPGDPAGPVIIGVLDEFAAEPGVRLADVAIVYRSVNERRSILTQLATSTWATASLVSDRTALAALTRAEAGFHAFGTVLVLEVLDGHTSYVCLGPDRDTLSADSWAFGSVDSDAAAAILPVLHAVATPPDAVVLCGAGAGDPGLTTALRRGLASSITLIPYHADAASRGAALVAAEQLRRLAPAAPPDPRRARRLLAAAVATTVLGTGALALSALRDESSPDTTSALTTVPVPPTTATSGRAPEARVPDSVPQPPANLPRADQELPAPQPGPGQQFPTPHPNPGQQLPTPQPGPDQQLPTPHPNPGQQPPTPQPGTGQQSPADLPDSGAERPAEPPDSDPPRTPSQTPEPTEPEPTPDAPPPRTTVGAPDGNWLFPGESPPPPWNADPELIRAWWANHWLLKEQWLHGG